MPIYEYQCQSCGHEHEALQKMGADPLTDCPVCQQPELVKKISAAGFRLKGGGWYETDFKSGSQKNVAGDKSASKPAASSGGCGSGSCGHQSH
jgi:putative FmdB family regulatory protein